MDEVVDSIVIGRPIEGDVEVMLFVQLADGVSLDEALVKKIRSEIRAGCTPRHVPAHVHAVPDIPYTISGKKVELAVRCVVLGEEVKNKDFALKNPEALDFYHLLRFVGRHLVLGEEEVVEFRRSQDNWSFLLPNVLRHSPTS